VLALSGIAAPVLFALFVERGSWPLAFAVAAAFPLAGWWLLGALSERRHTATR
jgi:hypothetical protein